MRALAVLESETAATVARVRADISAIRQRAADEGRAETASERAEIDTLLREATNAKHALDRRRSDDAMSATLATLDQGGPIGSVRPHTTTTAWPGPVAGAGRSLGAQVTDPFHRWWKDTRGSRGQRWEYAMELPTSLFAATLTSDPASGGDLVVPDYRVGIVPSPTGPVAVADLFASATTDSNLVTYMKEVSYTNAADTVAETAAKPESTMTFDAVSDPVRKVAHWLPVADEMVEDVPALSAYINQRLRLGVQLALDDQLLNGTAIAPDILGLRNRPGLGADVAMGTDTPADAILKAIAQVETATGHMVSGIAMNPANWHVIQRTKDTTGAYLGSGPFTAPERPVLWGKPVALTNTLPAGTAVVGAFASAAMIFYRTQMRVEVSASHQDFWIKNLLSVRCELRAALAVMVPLAFAEITGLT